MPYVRHTFLLQGMQMNIVLAAKKEINYGHANV